MQSGNPLFRGRSPFSRVPPPSSPPPRPTWADCEAAVASSSAGPSLPLPAVALALSRDRLAPTADSEICVWRRRNAEPRRSIALAPLRSLGEGAFGRVWLARSVDVASASITSESSVAVKQQSAPDLAAVRQTHRAGRELRVLRSLAAAAPAARAASLCACLIGACSSQGGGADDAGAPYLYLALEAAPAGATLLDAAIALRDAPAFPPSSRAASARFYLGCVLLALRELHALGVAFRDLKLDNVVLGAAADGYPRLIDFGLARSVAPTGAPCESCGWTVGHVAAQTAEADAAALPQGALDAAAERLAQLPCCTCTCVTGAEGLLPEPCVRLHRYHSPAESLVHLAKLHLTTIVAGSCDAGASPGSSDTALEASRASDFRRERAHSVVGSPAYMAFEVAAATGHGLSADVWSFGVLAHELLMGASPFSALALGANAEGEAESAAGIERRAAAAALDEHAILERAGASAAALVRAALNTRAELRPCVHALMRHRFFAEAEAEAAVATDTSAGDGAADRFFASLEARHLAPPLLPPLAHKDATASMAPPPPRFGSETFLAMAEEHYEARRQAGLNGGAVSSDTNEVAREFADEDAAGVDERVLSFE